MNTNLNSISFRLRQELSDLLSEQKGTKDEMNSNKKQVKRLQKELDDATKEQQDLLNEVR